MWTGYDFELITVPDSDNPILVYLQTKLTSEDSGGRGTESPAYAKGDDSTLDAGARRKRLVELGRVSCPKCNWSRFAFYTPSGPRDWSGWHCIRCRRPLAVP